MEVIKKNSTMTAYEESSKLVELLRDDRMARAAKTAMMENDALHGVENSQVAESQEHKVNKLYISLGKCMKCGCSQPRGWVEESRKR